jgi:hypothetical protein
LSKWSERGEVREAWERLAALEGLRGMRLIGRRRRSWILCWGGIMMLWLLRSMSKAREAGWTG